MKRYKNNRFIISKNNPIIKNNYAKLNDVLNSWDQEKNKIIVHKSKNISLNFNGSQLGNSFNVNGGNIFVNGKDRGNIQESFNQSQYSYMVIQDGLDELLRKIKCLGVGHTHILAKYRPLSIPVSDICNACQYIYDHPDDFVNSLSYVYNKNDHFKKRITDIKHINVRKLMEYALPNIINILNIYFESSDRVDLFLLFCAGIHPFNLSVMNSLDRLAEICSIFKNELDRLYITDRDNDSYTLLDICLTQSFINKYCFVKSEYINGFVRKYVFNILKFFIQLIDHQDSCYVRIAEPMTYKCVDNDYIKINHKMSQFGKLKYTHSNGRNLLLNTNQTISEPSYLLAQYDFGYIKPKEGDTIRITIWGTLGSNTQCFRTYNSTESCLIKSMLSDTYTSDSNGYCWSGTVDWTLISSNGSTVPNDKLLVYQYPQNNHGTNSTITKISLTCGEKKYEYSEAPEDVFYRELNGQSTVQPLSQSNEEVNSSMRFGASLSSNQTTISQTIPYPIPNEISPYITFNDSENEMMIYKDYVLYDTYFYNNIEYQYYDMDDQGIVTFKSTQKDS